MSGKAKPEKAQKSIPYIFNTSLISLAVILVSSLAVYPYLKMLQ